MRVLSLPLRLARRELRGGTQGFRVLIGCLILGVAIIAGVGTLSSAIIAGITTDSRSLLGGDVSLQLMQRRVSGDERAYLSATGKISEIVELRAMAQPANKTGPGESPGKSQNILVEIKAVDKAYPLYGAVVLSPPLDLGAALAAPGENPGGSWGAVAAPGLAERLGLEIGDSLRVGTATLVLRAVLKQEPDSIDNPFRLGPRLMVSHEALVATGLLQPGSLMHTHTHVKLPKTQAVGVWIEELQRSFPTAGWRIHHQGNALPGVRRFIERLATFLTLQGLATLLVGGIGIANAVRSHLNRKTETIAILKCLGASGGLVFQTYLLQVMAVAALAVVMGLILGAGGAGVAASLLGPQLPVAARIGFYPEPLLLAAAFGLLTTLIFALWPLARAQEIPPAQLFRDQVTTTAFRPGLGAIAAIAAAGTMLVWLAVSTVGEPRLALWFIGGMTITLVGFRAAGWAITAAAAVARRSLTARGGSHPSLRLALANLHRPGAPTANVVLSLGLGLSLLVAVALIEGNLARQVDERLPEKAPAFFFIDIQPDQTALFDATVAEVQGVDEVKRVPILRGRIVAINGVEAESATIAPEAQWAINGDRVLTYAASPPKGSQIVAGDWWPADYRGPPLVSFEAALAQGMGLRIGDSLTLNVLGREIVATIANLRAIDWTSMRLDFAVILTPGTLESAPRSYVASVTVAPESEEPLRQAVADRFDNITAIRVREMLEAANRILANIGLAARATASLTLLVGILVLAAAVAAGRQARVYDSVVLKVLGARRRDILASYILEFGLLGTATGLLAAATGSAVAWAVVSQVMGLNWSFSIQTVAATLILCLAITLVLGFAGTWRALGRKAAPILRNN
jgi:putative ABC transport system permease protein